MPIKPVLSRFKPNFNMARRQRIAAVAASFVGRLDWADDTPHDYPCG